jgi:myo-inositol-1(or 4)-monophosphatase
VQDSSSDARTLLAHIEAAAVAAADFIRARSADRSGLEWRAKSATDFVSDVDTGSERLIADALLGAFPHARILGEELSPGARAGARLMFIVDPLDGTTNFLHGYPEYAVSIAAVVDGAIEAGVVIDVPAGDRYTALRGGGAFHDGSPMAVSTIREPARALIGTGVPFKHPGELREYVTQLDPVARATAGVRRGGAAALDLAHVACGHFDAFWELSLAPWDFAAALLLIREAGGVVTSVRGGDVPLAPSSILAGNPVMHRWLADTLARAAAVRAALLPTVP